MVIPDIWLLILGITVAVLLLINLLFLLFRKNSRDILRSSADMLFRGQAELAGRMSQLAETASRQQTLLSDAINEQKLSVLKIMDDKLLAVTKSVGDGLQQSTNKTSETLYDLRERLAKIDVAQQKISHLSEQVVSLQEILANKQARGAFGEVQLNNLITSALPPSAYEFQKVLSNQKRADCVLKLPNPPGTIVIDSKFPLESYQALQKATSERDVVEAQRFFRASVLKHIKDIADKYIITGETAESALMFLPSEAVYAELYTNFTDVVEFSYKLKVWIVSPTTLMATLNTIRAILRDLTMKEQSYLIQKEVGLLLEDISRLDERILSLSKHFDAAVKDIDDIRVSSGKITRRIGKIEDFDLKESSQPSLSEYVAE